MTIYSVGDAVYIDSSRYGRADVMAGVVLKVTKSGQVTVKSGNREMRFTAHGRQVGGDVWHPVHLIGEDIYLDRLKQVARQAANRAALDAIRSLSEARGHDWNRDNLLKLIEAARIAVEALESTDNLSLEILEVSK